MSTFAIPNEKRGAHRGLEFLKRLALEKKVEKFLQKDLEIKK